MQSTKLLITIGTVAAVTAALAPAAAAQYPHRSINPALVAEPWPADWIGHPTASPTEFGVFHFRRSFDLETVPDSFVVHVSADNRYRLLVNGFSVSHGPARGDLEHWAFETVDLAPHLRAGRNVLAAVVWNFGNMRPVAQHSFRTAFILQGDTEASRTVDTGTGEWRVIINESYSAVPVRREDVGGAYIVVGPGEQVDASRYPWGWADIDYDDSEWSAARGVRGARQQWGTNYGEFTGWRLIPRAIPMPDEIPERLRRVVRTDGALTVMPGSTSDREASLDDFAAGQARLVIPPNTTASVLLDNEVLTTAYPLYTFSGGSGASVAATYAEALYDAEGSKGNRSEIDGKTIRGIRDRFLADGTRSRTFTPLWWRTYRYLQLDITTSDDTLFVDDVSAVFTAYPFRENARFTSSDSSLDEIWSVGWRTARLCAGETYFDCPYYEQLQYAGDTRIQAMISLYVSGDDRLVRQALKAFDVSRIPEGLTQSRYPAHARQIIPPYSLAWIMMVHDFWMHRDDTEFVEGFGTGIRAVLDWYEGLRDPDGLFKPTPWWNFVDWSFQRGVAPGADEGQSTVIALQYVDALEAAAELAEAFQRTDEAREYRHRAASMRESVTRLCWDAGRGLLADSPNKSAFSQHANVMAVLVDLVPEAEQAPLLNRMLASEDIVPVTYYFRFFLDRAMAKAGLADSYVDQLGPWHDMLALGLTTFAEEPEPTRSDAHAWSASPNYHLLATVCGITPSSPGFRTVEVAPALGPLTEIDCQMPHPNGFIEMHVERVGARIVGTVALPDGLPGTLRVNNDVIALEGGRTVSFD